MWIFGFLFFSTIIVSLLFTAADERVTWKEKKGRMDAIGEDILTAFGISVCLLILIGVWYIFGGFLCWDALTGQSDDEWSILDLILPLFIFCGAFPAILGLFFGGKK